MIDNLIEAVIAAQSQLIEALDDGNADAAIMAGERVAAAVARLRSAGAVLDTGETRALLDHALRQGQSARARVNYLSNGNRERMARLADHRGDARRHVYRMDGRIGPALRLI